MVMADCKAGAWMELRGEEKKIKEVEGNKNGER